MPHCAPLSVSRIRPVASLSASSPSSRLAPSDRVLFRRHATCRRSRCRRGRQCGEPKLLAPGWLRSADLLANGFLADAQPVRDRSVAQPLALQHLDAAQTFARDTPSTATPTLRAIKRCHPALRIASLVTPHSAHRPAKRPRHVRLLGKARSRLGTPSRRPRRPHPRHDSDGPAVQRRRSRAHPLRSAGCSGR